MTQVLAVVPDLLFGSRVVSDLSAGGHQVRLVSELPRRLEGDASDPVDVVVLDLTAEAEARLKRWEEAERGRARTLAFYSHVEGEVRERAQAAGVEVVVPRSRMAREGAALVERLALG